MVDEKLSGKSAVDDYFSSLLLDTQIGHTDVDADEPVLRFARVEPGFELTALWQGALSAPQQLCADLFLLSCLKTVSGRRLKKSMLDAIRIGKAG